MRGRKPIPTALKELKGTLRKDRQRPEPVPPPGRPEAPAWLSLTARAAWDELEPMLSAMRTLTKPDATALALTCAAFAEYRAASAVLEEHGVTYTVHTDSGAVVRQRPEVSIRKESWMRAMRGLTELGLTPSARTRVHPVGDGKQTSNPFDEFARGA